MLNLGIVQPGKTIYIPFDSFAATTGASITLVGLAVTDIEIYKDGSMTQRSSDAGYTLMDSDGIDLDLITGIHGISIDLANNSDAGFYAAGSKYWVVISSITIDGQTINFIAAYFEIGYSAAILNTTIATLASQTSFTLASGPAEDDALNGMSVVIHDVASGVQLGRAIVLDYTGATKTVTLAAGATFTVAATDNFFVFGPAPLQPSVAGALQVVQTGDSFARIGATGSGLTSLASQASVTTIDDFLDTEVAAILAAVDTEIASIIATLGVAGAGLTALATQASVNLIKAVTDALPNAGALTVIQADLDNIQTRVPAIAGDLLAIGGSTTAMDAFKRAVQGNVLFTVGSGSTVTSIITSSMTPAANRIDQFRYRILTFKDDTTTAALRGQTGEIIGSSATGVLTLNPAKPLTDAPVSGDQATIT